MLNNWNNNLFNAAAFILEKYTKDHNNKTEMDTSVNKKFSDSISSENQKVYDDYTREKVRIQSSNQFKTRLFQSLPFALPGIIGLIISVTGDSNQGWVIGSLLLTVLAPVGGIYLGARQSAKIPQQLQDLTNQFKIDYVCPKCGTFLGDIPWESLRNKKHCPVSSCQAKWVEE